jgi:hypothetical protein
MNWAFYFIASFFENGETFYRKHDMYVYPVHKEL